MRTFRSASAGRVLALVALHASEALAREAIAGAIWPNADGDMSLGSLRTALHSLRTQLNSKETGDAICSDRHFVWLDNDLVKTDMSAFSEFADHESHDEDEESLVERLAKAIHLVRGPLLVDMEDAWIVPHRLAMEDKYCQAVLRLMEVHTRLGDLRGATEVGRSALKVVPHREDIHVALIRCLSQSGYAADAIRQFEVLEKYLDDVWGERPSEDAIDALSADHRPAKGSVRSMQGDLASDSDAGSLIGRDTELEVLIDALARSRQSAGRIVTLTGFGGMGKTSLAQAAAARLAASIEVLVVDLEPLTDVDQIAGPLCRSAGIQSTDAANALDAFARKFSKRPVLVLLDNAEHLLPDISHFVSELVERVPSGRLLVTSRIALDLNNEQVIPLEPLSVPLPRMPLRALARNESVRALLRFGCLRNPSFALKTTNAQAISELCRALDGIPLAIELAANQLSVLTPAQILLRLRKGYNHQLPVHLGKRSGHRTMEEVVRWSYQLLGADLQSSFRSLGYLRGPFSIEAASALLGQEDAIASIRDLEMASLLQPTECNNCIRFRMLAPVREFARQSLDQSGETSAVRCRHREYFAGLAEQLAWELNGPDVSGATDAMDSELDHFRQVLDEANEIPADDGRVIRMTHFLLIYLIRRSLCFEWLSRLHDIFGPTLKVGDDGNRAIALCSRGTLRMAASQLGDAREDLAAALALFDQHFGPVERAGIRNTYALSLVCGDHREPRDEPDLAIELLSDAEELLHGHQERSLWDPAQLRLMLTMNRGSTYRRMNRNREAIVAFQAALVEIRALGIRRALGMALLALADNYSGLGDYAAAEVLARQSLEELTAMRSSGAVQAAMTLAAATGLQGRIVEAANVLPFAIHESFDRNEVGSVRSVLLTLAGLLLLTGRESNARELVTVARQLGQPALARFDFIGMHIPTEWFEDDLVGAPLDLADPAVLAAFERGMATLLPSKPLDLGTTVVQRN